MEVGLVVGLICVGKPAVAPQVEMILFGSSLRFPPCRQVLQALSYQGGPRTAVVQPEALLSPEAWSQGPSMASTPASVEELPKTSIKILTVSTSIF